MNAIADVNINCRNVVFRELVTVRELLTYFRLRYQEYPSAGFNITLNEDAFDMDFFDFYARFIGAFVKEKDEEILIGGVRMIERDVKGPNIPIIKELYSISNSFKKMIKNGKKYPFQLMEIIDISWLIHECDKYNKRLVEFGRTVIHREYRRSKVGVALVNAIFRLAAENGVDMGFGYCPEKLKSFYESTGCEVVGEFYHSVHKWPALLLKINIEDYRKYLTNQSSMQLQLN